MEFHCIDLVPDHCLYFTFDAEFYNFITHYIQLFCNIFHFITFCGVTNVTVTN